MTMPKSLRAGDTWRWIDSFSGYPAQIWTLTYTFYSATATFSIVANADGDGFLVDLPPSTTQNYAAGRYNYTARVADGTDRFEVDHGTFHVEPNPNVAPLDGRTHARRMLDFIDAALEGRAGKSTLDVVTADLNGRRLQYSIESLMKVRQLYAAEVQAEARRAGNAPGFVQQVFR